MHSTEFPEPCQAIDFLKLIFPRRSDGRNEHDWVCAAAFQRRADGSNDDRYVHWVTVDELHTKPARFFRAWFDPRYEWYTTPHAFYNTQRGQPLRNSARSAAYFAWFECDDPHITPHTVQPPPTYAVETSPGHHHFYWAFSALTSMDDIERVNRHIIERNGAKVDRRGWHRNRYLRIAGTSNHKRRLHPVRLVAYHPERLYTLDDFPGWARFDVRAEHRGHGGDDEGAWEWSEQMTRGEIMTKAYNAKNGKAIRDLMTQSVDVNEGRHAVVSAIVIKFFFYTHHVEQLVEIVMRSEVYRQDAQRTKGQRKYTETFLCDDVVRLVKFCRDNGHAVYKGRKPNEQQV